MAKYQQVGADVMLVGGERVSRGGTVDLTAAQYNALDSDQKRMLIELEGQSASGRSPLGFTTLDVEDTAVGLPSLPAAANQAIVAVETAAVRWRDDGTAPVAGVGGGIPLAAGDIVELDGDLSAYEFIRDTATNAVLSIAYYEVS